MKKMLKYKKVIAWSTAQKKGPFFLTISFIKLFIENRYFHMFLTCTKYHMTTSIYEKTAPNWGGGCVIARLP